MKYVIAAGAAVLGEISMQDWLFAISLLISILGMVRDILKERKQREKKQGALGKAPESEAAPDE